MRRRLFIAGLAAPAILRGVPLRASELYPDKPKADVLPGELAITLRPGGDIGDSRVQALLNRYDARIIVRNPRLRTWAIKIEDDSKTDYLKAELEALPIVQEVHWEMGGHLGALPTDPEYVNQGQFTAVNAQTAWGITTGDPNLKISFVAGGYNKLNNGEDPPGLLAGYNVTGNPSTSDTSDTTTSSHDSTCTRVIAEAWNSSWGASYLQTCQIWPTRCTTPGIDVPSLSNWALGVLNAVDAGARIMACSFTVVGGLTPRSDVLSACQYAYANDAIIVAPAGDAVYFSNEWAKSRFYPAGVGWPLVITSGGSVGTSSAGPSSEGGSVATIHMNLCTPWYNKTLNPPADHMITFTGTSSSSPALAGCIGLVRAANMNLKNWEVMEIIKQTAVYYTNGWGSDFPNEPVISLGQNWNQGCGWGQVDVGAACTMAQAATPGSIAPPNKATTTW